MGGVCVTDPPVGPAGFPFRRPADGRFAPQDRFPSSSSWWPDPHPRFFRAEASWLQTCSRAQFADRLRGESPAFQTSAGTENTSYLATAGLAGRRRVAGKTNSSRLCSQSDSTASISPAFNSPGPPPPPPPPHHSKITSHCSPVSSVSSIELHKLSEYVF